MTEEEQIERTKSPATLTSLTCDFEALELSKVPTLMVHSSLSSLGWVVGGSQAVVLALQRALGEEVTLVMPSHSSPLCDPAGWSNPPVPQSWFETIRQEMPAFFGERSPLARLYDLDAFVLLLGVGHESNTSLHLAEYRANWPGKKIVGDGAPILVNGERRWQRYEDLDLVSDDFPTLGEDFERDTNSVRTGHVGLAECRLMSQRAAVDYAVGWMERNRT